MPDHPSTLAGVFGRPFPEQVAFFRQKLGNLVPTARWDDMLREEHDRGFMVAGAASADLLSDLAAAVDKAIAEGRGIEEFRKDFRAIVAKNGWTGWTGEGSTGGEAWRVKTILRTNAYTSYSAGRVAQLEAGNFPLWVYRHGGSLEPRPEHLSWDGWAGPPTHPFWAKHYPPSDWGCSCYVIGARTAAGVRRVGGNPDKQLPGNWQSINPKTGEPVGIGKGWGYAPGRSVSSVVQAIATKIGSWDYRVAKAFMQEVPLAQRDALAESYRALPSTADDARRYAQNVWNGEADALQPGRTLGLLTDNQAQAIGDKVKGFDFSLSPTELGHVRDEHGNDAKERRQGQRAVTPQDFARLPQLLNVGSQPRHVGVSDGHKMPVYEISAVFGGDEFVTRWAMWSRRRTMTLLTFFVRTGKGS
jgi:Phage Mu protein F like protein